jgi:hypothetical protein
MKTQVLADQLAEFVDGHKGWKVLNFPALRGQAFASKQLPRVPMLLLHTYDVGRHPWAADVTWGLATDFLHSTRGSFEEVTAWVAEWERVLSLPVRLAECRSRRAAKQMCGRTPRSHIAKLAGVLDIAGDDEERQRELVSRFAPQRRGW